MERYLIPNQKIYSLAKKLQILVIGHDNTGCTSEHEKIAYETGCEIAKANAVLVTGGLLGIMKAANRGAKDSGGITVGIIPQDDPSHANEFCDIVIPTGMGMTRDFLTALAADGIIVIGGGSGTLAEICAGYMHKKPMVALKNSGGVAQEYADKFLDYRNRVKIVGVESPQEAVKKIIELITA